MNQAAFTDRLNGHASQVEGLLAGLLTTDPSHGPGSRDPRLVDAMRHAVLGGGKRLRPFLVVETAAMFGVDGAGPMRAGAALELVHCYSLVHDDLPAMDNDDLRRGKPTVHRAFDEATAILAGDALLTLAFEIVADPATAAEAGIRAALVLALSRQAGLDGMVGGQMLDLAAEGRFGPAVSGGNDAAEAHVIRIQSMKTGALIAFGCAAGAILGRATPEEETALAAYAAALGLAFQIKDDLLDAEGDVAVIGKAAGKDAAAGKATFVGLLGIGGATARLEAVTASGVEALRRFGHRAEVLLALLEFNRHRRS